MRAYDPKTGQERWRLGQLEDHGADAGPAEGSSLSRAAARPERPIFVVGPDARGDITPPMGATSDAGSSGAKTGRGPYMPTPLAYDGLL